MKKIILLLSLQLCLYIGYAQTFTIDSIQYNITSSSPSEVEVIDSPNATGDILIPSTIIHSSITYSVTQIGLSAFNDNQLTSVAIPNNIRIIRTAAFANNELRSIVIPNSVISIDDGAFNNNKLDSLNIGENLTTIGMNAFSTNQLKNITFPNSLQSIGITAFQSNELENITLGEGVTSIGNSAFLNNKLTSITLGENIASIGDYAFFNNKLTSITVENTTPILVNTETFMGIDMPKTTLNVPAGSESAYKTADVWKEFKIGSILNVNASELTNEVTIYPNPVSELVNVSVEDIENGSIKVLTSTGGFVQQEVISNGTAQFNVNGKAGLYFIEVTSDNRTAVFKVIKD